MDSTNFTNNKQQLSVNDIFTQQFINQCQLEEQSLQESKSELSKLQEEIKYFSINQPQYNEIQQCIDELIEYFKDSVKNQEYSQYLPTNEAKDVIKNLQAFEKKPPNDQNFIHKVKELNLNKYINVLRQVDKHEKNADNPLKSITNLFKSPSEDYIQNKNSPIFDNSTLEENELPNLFSNNPPRVENEQFYLQNHFRQNNFSNQNFGNSNFQIEQYQEKVLANGNFQQTIVPRSNFRIPYEVKQKTAIEALKNNKDCYNDNIDDIIDRLDDSLPNLRNRNDTMTNSYENKYLMDDI